MKASIKIFYLIPLFFLFFSCQEEQKSPLTDSVNIPAPLSNVRVENIPGGAKINYTLPDDPDVLYVMASFSTRKGEERVVKSSVFRNYVMMEGFGDTNEYSVTLYTVSRSEKKSSPVVATIQPLVPPVKKVAETLDVFEEYGGIGINFVNEGLNEFTLFTMVKDSLTNEWTEHDRFYTSSKEWTHLVRGLPPVQTDFAIYFSDKWKNNSDTLFTSIKPLYEVEFDYTLFENLKLQDDVWKGRYSRDISTLWLRKGYLWIDKDQYPGLTLPNWFTVDVGKKYKFGRMTLESADGGGMYARGAPRLFQIYGSNNPTTDWADWTLIGDFEVIKPSGAPLGTLTPDDIAYAEAGWDFSFPRSDESYRYFRFKMLTTWGIGDPYLIMIAFRFWGEPQE